MHMNKQAILALVIAELSELLQQAELAAKNAHNAAIDDQSVAETQYDTLAIEAAYLAEGQSRRIDEINAQLQQLSTLNLIANTHVELGALVALEYHDDQLKYVFLLPCGAGVHIHYQQQDILIVTPQAPLAKAILGKVVDDDFELMLANKKQTGFISLIY